MEGFNRFVVHLKHSLLLLLRLELRPVVDICKLLVVEIHDQVDFAVAVHILKFGGSWYLCGIVADNEGTVIDAGTSDVAARQLNDDHAAFQVQHNKMGRMVDTVSMAYHGISLVGSGCAVSGVELVLAPPGTKHLQPDPQRDTDEHADAHKEQPMRGKPSWQRFGMKHHAPVTLLKHRVTPSVNVAARTGRQARRVVRVGHFFTIIVIWLPAGAG